METKYTRVYIINDKLVVADKIEKAIALYKCKFPCRKIESLTLLNNTLRSDSYDKDFDALIEDVKSKGKNEVNYEHATINQKDFALKEEPRFKVGYWIVNKESKEVFRIEKILVNTCEIVDDEGNDYHVPNYILEEDYDIWTIDDAMAGDVLATEGFVFIFKEIREDKGIGYFCANENELHEGDDSTFHIAKPDSLMGSINNDFTHYTPATKEQRDTLIKAMNKAGWEFDFEKKELKKIESETEIPFGAKDSELQEVTYYIPKGFHAEIDDNKVVIKKGKKPTAWSEEDEDIIEEIEAIIDAYVLEENNPKALIDWLKTLKDRYTWKPSEEQMDALETATSYFQSSSLESLYNKLKKL